MKLNYSNTVTNEAKTAKAMCRDLDISFKHAVNVCDKLRGMMLTDAIALLEAVVNLEKTIPFRKFQKGIGHRKGTEEFKIAKYPQKAAGEILKALKNLETNAVYKGLDAEKMKVTHIQAQKGVARMRRKPKGRWKAWKMQLVNVQIMAEEK